MKLRERKGTTENRFYHRLVSYHGMIMIRFKNGLRGNLSVPITEQKIEPEYQTLPLTAFHKKDKEGKIVIEPDPSAAVRGRSFAIENKK